MDGAALSIEELEALSRLPARDVLNGQLVGVLASPITGLVRGLNGLVAGLAIALGQIAEQGLVGGASEPEPAPEPAAEDDGGGRAGRRGRSPRRSAGRGRAGGRPDDNEPPRRLQKAEDRPIARRQMATSTEEWIDELKGITVLELSERIKALEEAFGVSATAVAAAAPAAGGAGDGAAEEEESSTVESSSRAPATRRSR